MRRRQQSLASSAFPRQRVYEKIASLRCGAELRTRATTMAGRRVTGASPRFDRSRALLFPDLARGRAPQRNVDARAQVSPGRSPGLKGVLPVLILSQTRSAELAESLSYPPNP